MLLFLMYSFCLLQHYFSIVSAHEFIIYLFTKHCSDNIADKFKQNRYNMYAFLFYYQYIMITNYLQEK